LSSVIWGREKAFACLFPKGSVRKRRRGRRRKKNPLLVTTCGKPAGQALPVELYEHHDDLMHVRESVGRRGPDIRGDRPQLHIPNGMKSELLIE
jgi:hypothetical protein